MDLASFLYLLPVVCRMGSSCVSLSFPRFLCYVMSVFYNESLRVKGKIGRVGVPISLSESIFAFFLGGGRKGFMSLKLKM